MSAVCDKRFQAVELENSCIGHLEFSEPDSDPQLRVTVLFTTPEGTVAALRAAQALARNLEFQLALVAFEVVSFHFPLDRPPVPVDFLVRRSITMVSDSGIDAREVSLELYLCRDRKQGLQRFLVPNSLVVIGGSRHWWIRQQRKLEQYVRSLGHRVIFVDLNPKSANGTQSFLHSG